MMLRVVLDTNVIVSALLKPGALEDQVLRLALAGKIRLCTSPAVMAEYARVLPKPKLKFQPQEITRALQYIEQASDVVRPTRTLAISDHPSDNRFYECAEAARADYLVTGNAKHFTKDYKTTKIVNARQLLDLIAPQK